MKRIPISKYVDTLVGPRRLLRPVDNKSQFVTWDQPWKWICMNCNFTGVSGLRRVLGSKGCPRCSKTHYRGPKYKVGDRVGVWVIAGINAPGSKKTRGEAIYEVRCTRCGYETIRASGKMRFNQESCQECRDKFEICGELLSYDEIEAVFGIKRSLVLHRTGRKGMSFDEAVLTTVQPKYDPKGRNK
jgi:hypothetical protein